MVKEDDYEFNRLIINGGPIKTLLGRSYTLSAMLIWKHYTGLKLGRHCSGYEG